MVQVRGGLPYFEGQDCELGGRCELGLGKMCITRGTYSESSSIQTDKAVSRSCVSGGWNA